MTKRRGRDGEVLRTGEYYDPIKDRYKVRPDGWKNPVHAGKHLAAARRLKRELERGRISEGGRVRGSVTLAPFTDRWADLKRELGRRSWAHSKALVVNHVLAHLGHMQVRDIGVPEMRATVMEWRRWMEREDRAPKTVHDIHRALSSLMELAVADEIIAVNPCKNQHVRDLLPELDPNQEEPSYDEEEAWAFLTDPRVPWDRRMINAGQALAGMRVGESAGRRESDWDRSAPILGCMLIRTQYQDQILKSGRGRDRKPRQAPVHPAYDRMLAHWWDGDGYESIYRRRPTPGGFIVPDRRDWTHARTRNQLLKAHERDAERLGIEHKGTNAFKRYFETFAHKGGAREDMLERITHNRRGTIVNVYIDKNQLWPELCAAVRCLKVDLSRGQVISLERRRGS